VLELRVRSLVTSSHPLPSGVVPTGARFEIRGDRSSSVVIRSDDEGGFFLRPDRGGEIGAGSRARQVIAEVCLHAGPQQLRRDGAIRYRRAEGFELRIADRAIPSSEIFPPNCEPFHSPAAQGLGSSRRLGLREWRTSIGGPVWW
jgi:hypothetical protein